GRHRDVAYPLAAAVEFQSDAGDLLRFDAVPLAHLAGALDRPVRQVAGGVVLEEVGEDVKAARRLGQGLLGVEIRAVGESKTLLALDEIGAAGEAAGGQPRRQEAVVRRLAGME